jgi:vacuolar-type H+-ATPase subunit I/STV1
MSRREALDAISDAVSVLDGRVSDFPGPTCSSIDSALDDIKDVAKTADRLEREGDRASVSELLDFVKEADALLGALPDALEELRNMNDRLRTALHEALDSRKEAMSSLQAAERACSNIEEVEEAA